MLMRGGEGSAEGPAPGIPLERLEQKDLKFLKSLGYAVTPCLTQRRRLMQGKRERDIERKELRRMGMER